MRLKAQVEWIVGNTHVGTSYFAVARDIYRRCKRAGVCRNVRSQCVRWALEAHRANRQLCIDFRL